MVQMVAARAGVSNISPHVLHHTLAPNLRRKGADLLLIKESLGHVSILTTQIYADMEGGEYLSKMRRLVN